MSNTNSPSHLSMNRDPRQSTKPANPRLRIWNWIFVCAQTIALTLMAIFLIQTSRGYKTIDTFYHPIAGPTVIVLLLFTPLFLIIVTPFFWKRLFSAQTGFLVGLIVLAYDASPTF
jgi:hypothetical protein